ncbi:unnamed protein product [Aspergillus oryzae]|uniref:Unnamed protein product n=1 Tax=Aspergillus oryzae TaxID=5062 RepID=A0AAN5BWI0_ASPOZ|nr:unnamed protein product [Aspergillus oryzae]
MCLNRLPRGAPIVSTAYGQCWNIVHEGYYAFVEEQLARGRHWLVNMNTGDSLSAGSFNLEQGLTKDLNWRTYDVMLKEPYRRQLLRDRIDRLQTLDFNIPLFGGATQDELSDFGDSISDIQTQFNEAATQSAGRPLFPSNLGFVGRRIKLFDFETAVQMYSVDIITMETVNPDMYPLPSIELLNMQFAFARALRLRGAADLDQEEVDSSDSEKEEDVLVAQPRGRAYNLQESQYPSRVSSRTSTKGAPGSRDTSRSFSLFVRSQH